MSESQGTLGDVVQRIETGRSPKTLERDALPSEAGILKVSAVSWGQFDATAAKAMPNDFVGTDAHRVHRGDFIISRANTMELTGAVAIAQADHPNRYLSDKLLRLVLDQSKVDPEYLLYAMRSPQAREHIERHASGTSNSMRNIAQEPLLQTPIKLPPLAQQLQMTAALRSQLEDASVAADGVGRQAATAQRLTAAILAEGLDLEVLAVGPRQDAGYSLLTSLARLESGHTPSRRHPEWWGGDVPWLALPDIRKLHGKVALQTIENTNDPGLQNSSARLLPVGTVCVSRTASVGFVTMLGKPMATSQDFCNWVCDPAQLDPEFLMYAFMASQDHLRELSSGAVHKSIYMPTIQSFHLRAPALAEQRRIARRLRDQLAAAEALQQRLAERQADIQRLPQRILAAAFGAAA